MAWGRIDLMDSGYMSGLTRKGVRKHPVLYLMHGCVVAGGLLASAYLLRLTTKNPDCCIDRANNPHPWQKLGVTGQYKFLTFNIDYANLKAPEERPVLD